MDVYLTGHNYRYECEKICRIFYPAEHFSFYEDFTGDMSGDFVKTEIRPGVGGVTFSASARVGSRDAENSFTVSSYPVPGENEDSAREKLLARAIVAVFSEITGVVPPWGVLTGVRPSKLMRSYTGAFGKEKAKELFRDYLGVSEEKISLASGIEEIQSGAVNTTGPGFFSLYISVPFCPTRCSYCSFVSHSIASAGKLIPEYVRLLCEEIKYAGALASVSGKKLQSVYMGGGTPTTLSAGQLDMILSALYGSFDMSGCLELTVEAGRPDTIDADKLGVLKNHGVSRISINPQTFSDDVLRAIGRPHTGEDAVSRFELARSMGFDNINMDFIAGLTGDTPGSFARSIDRAVSLAPENITVHTLSVKTSSSLAADKEGLFVSDAASMLSYAKKVLTGGGYSPYYMYRQSKMVGNLENVGWCKEGTQCLYNIYMMEELHSVLSVGAGGVTKIVGPDGGIERIYNFKYPYEYISRFEEIRQRKDLFAGRQ